ncbi:unnamed protein product, partial [Rotaria sp. Silwood1]
MSDKEPQEGLSAERRTEYEEAFI